MNSPLNAERPGLCMTCNNAAYCVYRSQRGFDAIYCEMYDCHPLVKKGDDKEATITSVKPQSKKTIQHPCKGLCSNCENFENCLLPKPEEGVWHCEEYR
jgi:hypothetical protein